MTTGQVEKYVACIFNFGHRVTTALNVSTFLPFIGGTNQATDLSFIVPLKGKLKNLYWDCNANSLAANSYLEVHIGDVHSTPSTVAPGPAFPPGTPGIAINLQGNKTTNNPPLSSTPCPDPLNLDVLPGQRVAVYVRRTGGTILKLRVSFELEVEKASETFQLASDNTTVFYDGGNVGIGTAFPLSKLHVTGDADISQLIIDAAASQSKTNPLIKLRKSDGSDLIWIGSDDVSNTFIGVNSGIANTPNIPVASYGLRNTFIGNTTGSSNSSGYANTAVGSSAFLKNTSGCNNTAIGTATLFNNTGGYFNTAIGSHALNKNMGGANVAVGNTALFNNTNGSNNNACGHRALFSNTEGFGNTANGDQSLTANNTGNYNTAVGASALNNNINGSSNSAFGVDSGVTSSDLNNATAIGAHAKVSTSNSLVLGDLNVNVGIGTTSPTEKLDVMGSIRIKDGNEGKGKVLTSDASGKGSWANPPMGFAPIGSIIAWVNVSVPSQPTLPDGWKECNGQVVADPDSPLLGIKIPNLNGEERFLRGSNVSGTMQEDAFQTHNHACYIAASDIHQGYGFQMGNAAPVFSMTNEILDPVADQHGNPPPRVANETRPKNMSVIWIMRVK